MVTYSDLFALVMMLCRVVTLVVTLTQNKKPAPANTESPAFKIHYS